MILKIPNRIYSAIQADLDRAHPYAFERVGFLFCRSSRSGTELILQGVEYQPVKDEQYTPSEKVGAIINSDAIRAAMQVSLSESLSAFHVHKHSHRGRPWFSPIDLASLVELVPAFFGVNGGPHGALVFSENKAAGLAWSSRTAQPLLIERILTVGFPMRDL